jgi:uncharacterized protein (DUF58 family)
MIPKEIIQKIRRIEIKTGRLVSDVFSGQYESVFKGRGMEFSEVREYEPGDDIRTIDWNVTARYGKPFVKKFIEERELTVMLLVDASASGRFGTSERMKEELAAELAAVLAFSAIKNNDKVGMIIFTDRVEKYILPKKGRTHILRIISEMLFFKPAHKNTDITSALEYLNEVAKRKSVVFLISDFIGQGFEKALGITNKKHDVIAMTITDPREKELPAIGFVELEDSESGEYIMIDTRDRGMRDNYASLSMKRIEDRKKLFRRMGLDNVDFYTDKPYVEPLIRFFEMRARRFR